MYEERKKKGLTVEPVMLHCGYMHGSEKQQKLQAMGLWKADTWDPNTAIGHFSRLVKAFPRKLPKLEAGRP